MKNDDVLLTLDEVRILIGYKSPSSLWKLRKSTKKSFPRPVNLGTGQIRFWRSDVNLWLSKLRQHPY